MAAAVSASSAQASLRSKPWLAVAVGIPALLLALAANNRSKGIQEGKKAELYPMSGRFGAHPPPERSGGGI